MKSAAVLLGLFSMTGLSIPALAQGGPAEAGALARSRQLIVVITPRWDAVEGRLERYERATGNGQWRRVGEPIAIVVGKNGLGWGIGLVATDDSQIRLASDPVKREGDGKAPAGVFTLGTAFGYNSQALEGSKMPYLVLSPSIECVDDSDSKYYNRLMNRTAVAADWRSAEHMRSAGESYRWGIVVDHNGIVTEKNSNPPEPGGGSCIFLHIWHSRDQGTVGCTAMPQPDLESLLAWLDPARGPLLVQLPEPAYARVRHRWGLPASMTSPAD